MLSAIVINFTAPVARELWIHFGRAGNYHYSIPESLEPIKERLVEEVFPTLIRRASGDYRGRRAASSGQVRFGSIRGNWYTERDD